MRERDRIEWLESLPDFPPRPTGTMQWARRDGTMAEYAGELIDLGHGIPRPRSRRPMVYRMQRAVWHLSFGYVSGFPIIDVLAFTARAFWGIPLPADPIPDALVEIIE